MDYNDKDYPVQGVKRIDGEEVKYGRSGCRVSHAVTRPERYVYYNKDDCNYRYNPETGISKGAKGKEILAHELGHLKGKKDKQVYDGPNRFRRIKGIYHSEKRADLSMIKRLKKYGDSHYTKKDYQRFINNFNKETLKRHFKDLADDNPNVKSFSDLPVADQKGFVKHYHKANPGIKARDDLLKHWDKYNLGEQQQGGSMSYAKYLLETYVYPDQRMEEGVNELINIMEQYDCDPPDDLMGDFLSEYPELTEDWKKTARNAAIGGMMGLAALGVGKAHAQQPVHGGEDHFIGYQHSHPDSTQFHFKRLGNQADADSTEKDLVGKGYNVVRKSRVGGPVDQKLVQSLGKIMQRGRN